MATMVATEDTDTVTATADMATTVTMARGRLKPLLWLRLIPRLLPNLATDTTVMDMAMVMDMATTVMATATMARGPLMLDTMAMEDMATDMATEDTDMGMAMDTTAKGLQMLDTMAMVATAMAMAMVTDMAMDMDTMDKKED